MQGWDSEFWILIWGSDWSKALDQMWDAGDMVLNGVLVHGALGP